MLTEELSLDATLKQVPSYLEDIHHQLKSVDQKIEWLIWLDRPRVPPLDGTHPNIFLKSEYIPALPGGLISKLDGLREEMEEIKQAVVDLAHGTILAKRGIKRVL